MADKMVLTEEELKKVTGGTFEDAASELWDMCVEILLERASQISGEKYAALVETLSLISLSSKAIALAKLKAKLDELGIPYKDLF